MAVAVSDARPAPAHLAEVTTNWIGWVWPLLIMDVATRRRRGDRPTRNA